MISGTESKEKDVVNIQNWVKEKGSVATIVNSSLHDFDMFK